VLKISRFSNSSLLSIFSTFSEKITALIDSLPSSITKFSKDLFSGTTFPCSLHSPVSLTFFLHSGQTVKKRGSKTLTINALVITL